MKEIITIMEELSPWYHNIHLPSGEQTAPQHPLGDFPNFIWKKFSGTMPVDMSPYTVLDIGCNSGFYAIECAKRGAAVTAIDPDIRCIEQARWVAEESGVSDKITFHQMQVYDLVKTTRKFDIVFFMGLFYQLRYPLLAMDIITEKVKKLLIFQSLNSANDTEDGLVYDFGYTREHDIEGIGWQDMTFAENTFPGDPANMWLLNSPAVKAIFRNAGFKFNSSPGHGIFFFEPDQDNLPVTRIWNEPEYLSATGKEWRKKKETTPAPP